MNNDEMNKTKICAQLWNGIAIKPAGTSGICCEITEHIPDLNVREHTFDQMLRHPKIEGMRQQMLNGEEPKECWRCFSKEKLGAHSLRHTLNEHYIGMNGAFDSEFISPQNIEFVLGNLCQLRCVMCHPSRSAKVAEAHDYIAIKDMRKSYEGLVARKPFNMDVSWVEDPLLWDSIAEQSLPARRIFINGGEPLLAKEHEKVLDRLIENGVADQTLLVYSTNGLLLADHHIEKWRKFQNVAIAFSLDDLFERNHFIRYPSDWGQIKAALDRVKGWQADPANKNIEINMWCAINVLNFAYLPEYIDFFAANYPDAPIGWRAVQTPEYLNPMNLPKEFKSKVAKEILYTIARHKAFHNKGLGEEIRMIEDTEPNPNLLQDGIAFLKMNAEHQGVDLHELFPRMKQFLD